MKKNLKISTSSKSNDILLSNLKFIKKRDGEIRKFELKKIEDAIFKALKAGAYPNYNLAGQLANKVAEKLSFRADKEIVSVEDVQDLVEETLQENGLEKIASLYHNYRLKRAEIRAQKQIILNKKEIDEIDKKFDLNALKVLAARYLKKNEKGEVIESLRDLFERVTTHSVLPSLFYDKKVFKNSKKNSSKPTKAKPKINFSQLLKTDLKIGKYKLNEYHKEALVRLFQNFSEKNQIKISWAEFLQLFESGYFDKYETEIKSYFNLLANRQFFLNTPALVNFGNALGLGSACFVLDIEDSMVSIMDTLKNAALIFQAGGGVGYNFSNLRPEGDYVKSTSGAASGPISFMKLYDSMTETIKQGGIRRGANMGILDSNHLDIEKFIKAKAGNQALRNFNISVLIKGDFWKYFRNNKPYPLINPRTKKVVKFIKPKELFNLIAFQAWESGEPGVIFEDRINEYNPFYESLGPIRATNPCGELLLYPTESCNLGSLNLLSFVKENEKKEKYFDFDELAKTVKLSIQWLDNVIDVNKYPLKEIQEMTQSTRKIGLGIMGLGDLLYSLEISYDSAKGRKKIEEILEFINYQAKIASLEIAKKRGPFPYFPKSSYAKGILPFRGFKDKKSWHFNWAKIAKDIKKYGLRNSYTMAVAPTGSLSMIAGCSSGMEPVYSLVYEKNVSVGNFYYLNQVFEEKMESEGLMSESLVKNLNIFSGSIQKIEGLPKKWKKIFKVAHDISPSDHIRALAAVQKWVDSSVSKTINFPASATKEDIYKAYILGYKLHCKDISVFRDTSIKNQVLVGGTSSTDEIKNIKDEKAKGFVIYQEGDAEKLKIEETKISQDSVPATPVVSSARKCPSCGADLVKQEGCYKCPVCGYGLCA